MNNINYVLWIIIVIIFAIFYLLMDKLLLRFFKIENESVSPDNAKSALDRIATWATWLTGLQTGSIAAIGFLFTNNNDKPDLIGYAFFTLLFFGSSIVLSTWLLSSLPSIQQRLLNSKEPDPKNDIYMMDIFTFVHLRMGRFTGLIHTYFLIGIVFFALFVFKLFSH